MMVTQNEEYYFMSNRTMSIKNNINICTVVLFGLKRFLHSVSPRPHSPKGHNLYGRCMCEFITAKMSSLHVAWGSTVKYHFSFSLRWDLAEMMVAPSIT